LPIYLMSSFAIGSGHQPPGVLGSLHREVGETNEAITMPTLSQGAYIAWQLAAGEAIHAGHQYIENEDVFIGLCKLGTWLRSMKQRGKLVPNGKVDLRDLYAEAEIIEEALRTFALSPSILGNTVRAVVEKGTASHPKRIVHRSKACKIAFQRAAALAVAARVGEIHCMHLLAALLEHPGALLTRALAIFGVNIKEMHSRIVAITSALDARQTRAESKAKAVSHLIYVGMDFNT
jgi:Clp amino terminal domain, pathogenicity island component